MTHNLLRSILILSLALPASAERLPFEISMTAALEAAGTTEVASHAEASPWRVAQSIPLGEPPSHFSWTQHPKVSATEAGFCAAWLDRRQGGAILATRIAADGTVLDPTGIPLAALGDKAPWVVFSAPGGCVVGWNVGATLHGQFIPDDPNEAPRPAFTITVPRRILRAEHDRLLVWIRDWNGDSLRLYDARGVQLGFLDYDAIDPQLVVLDVLEIDGRLIMLSTTSEWDRWWIHELDSSLSATLLGRPEENTLPRGRTAAGGTEAGLIAVAEVSSSGSEIELEWVELALDGELIAAGETTIPVGGALSGMREISGENRLVIRGYSGNSFLVSDIRAADPTIDVIEGTDLAIASSGTRTIFVSYGHRPDGRRGLVFELDQADGHGEPLTESRVDQRLHDTAADGGHVALLWSEKEVDRNRLLLGIFSGEEMDLTATLTVAEFESDRGPNPQLTTVEMADGVILVAWSEYLENRFVIRYRRASIEGAWLDDVKALPVVGSGGERGGLVRSGGAFVLVFSSSQGDTAARIDLDGTVGITMIPSRPSHPDLVLAVEEGFVFLTAAERLCEFICLDPITIAIWLDLYDHHFQHLARLTPQKGLGGAGIPYMEAGDDTILVGSERGVYLFERLAAGIWTEAREIDLARGTAASWVEDRYLVAGHRIAHSQSLGTNDSAILIGEVMPEGNAFAALAPIVVDWVAPRSFPSAQRVHQLGDRLFLFANAITLEPEHAYVRRIRAHELVREEGPVRRRAVGRR